MKSFLRDINRMRVRAYQLICFITIILFTTSAYAINYVSEPNTPSSNSVIDANYETYQAQDWSGEPDAIYDLSSVENVVIENIIIDGDDSNPNTDIAGILLRGTCSNITLRNCVIKNCLPGIEVGGQGTNVDKLNIKNCIVEQCDDGILFEQPTSYAYISDCTITDCDRPILFQVTGGTLGDVNHVSLNNVRIEEVGAQCYPIKLVGIQYFLLNNVSVIGPNTPFSEGGTADHFAMSGCQDGVVSKSYSEGGGNHGFAADYNSALSVSPQRILFVGNTALSDANAGFYVSGLDSNDIIFADNFSWDNSNGIVIDSGVKNIVSQNTCGDNTNYGIHLGEDVNDTIITCNILSGNGTNEPNYNPNMRTEEAHNIIGD